MVISKVVSRVEVAGQTQDYIHWQHILFGEVMDRSIND